MIPHGTRSGYRTHRCRCADCRRANAEHVAGTRSRRRARLADSPSPESDPGHGTQGGYDAGCRCEACSLVRQSRYWNEEHGPRRHLWREHVTETYRSARDAWEALRESGTLVPASFSSGGEVAAYQLEEFEFRQWQPAPTLRHILEGLKDSF